MWNWTSRSTRQLVIALVLIGTLGAQATSPLFMACRELIADPQIAKDLYRALKNTSPQEVTYEDMDQVARATLSYYKSNYPNRNILVFTDASWDQKSGVITVMKLLRDKIKQLSGLNVIYVTPEDFKLHLNLGKAMQDVRVAHASDAEIQQFLKKYNPAAIHIMVEGSVGFKVKSLLTRLNVPFTSAYHTDFPQYAANKVPMRDLGQMVMRLGYNILKGFHKDSDMIMAPTATMGEILVNNGFRPDRIGKWSHGVEINRFDPKLRQEGLFEQVLQEGLKNGTLKTARKKIEGPVLLFVGRIEKEKNLLDFLKMKVPGTKVLIGDGALRESLQSSYPDAVFLGKRNYEDLPAYYASADLFVMTSLTETFGLVMLEAAASGVPVLAYRVQGPIDVMTDKKVAVLVDYNKNDPQGNVRNLEEGYKAAIKLRREDARAYAEMHPWEHSIVEFLYFLTPLSEATQQRLSQGF